MINITQFFRFTLFMLLTLVINNTGYSQAGTLDTSFGTDGITLFDILGFHDSGNDIKCLNDGSMYVTGSAMVAYYDSNGYIMKLNPDGTIDTTWATDGFVTMIYGEDTYPYNMEILADGKIVVSGVVYVTATDSEFFVSKFNADGTPDTTFGTNGVFLSSYSNEEEYCETMMIQPDDKIVLAGRTYLGAFSQLLFMRLNADGTLDTSFGTTGYTEIDASIQGERINGLALLSDDTIVGAGYGYQSDPWFTELMVIAKLNPDGSPDTSFGGDGVVIPDIATAPSNAYNLAIKDDYLFVTGNIGSDLFIAKLDALAVGDPTFGTNGIATININLTNTGLDLLLPGDDKVYVSGVTGTPGMNNRDFFLLRYLADGTLDPDFNTVGYVVTDIRPDWDAANALDMQSDGKIVCAGMSGGISTSGNNDIAVTRYLNDYNPSAGISELSSTYVTLYPNPASQSLKVDLCTLDNTSDLNIKVYNAIGSLIETIDIITSDLHTINTSKYKSGVYYMSLVRNNGVIANKVFVVEN